MSTATAVPSGFLAKLLSALEPSDYFAKKTALLLANLLSTNRRRSIALRHKIHKTPAHPTQWLINGQLCHEALMEGCGLAGIVPPLQVSGVAKTVWIENDGSLCTVARLRSQLHGIGVFDHTREPKTIPVDWSLWSKLSAGPGTQAPVAPEPEPEPKTVTIKRPETKAAEGFPIQDVQELAARTRTAVESGNVTPSCEVNLRRMATWGRLYYAFIEKGESHADSLDVGFMAAVYWGVEPEEQVFLGEIYYQIFARKPELPKVFLQDLKTDLAKKCETIHDMLPILTVCIEYGVPTWIFGVTGSGKSVAVEQALDFLGIPQHRVQGAPDTTGEDVLGSMAAKDGETYFKHGFLPTAMAKGEGLVLDEFDVFRPAVEAEFRAVLEGKPLVLKGNAGEVVNPDKRFRFVASCNTLGLGEKAEYVGTAPVNEATRCRFAFLTFPHMSKVFERKALKATLEKFQKDFIC